MDFNNRIGNYKAGFVPEDCRIKYSSIHYIWRIDEYDGKLFLGTFVSSDDGLYIGTANPFYGGQLWRLNKIKLAIIP